MDISMKDNVKDIRKLRHDKEKKIVFLLLVHLSFVQCTNLTLTWHSDFVTMYEAQAICERDGGTLVNDVTEIEGDILKAMQERYVTSIWQGKYVTPWVWQKGCFNFDNLHGFQTVVRLTKNQMTECVKYCSRWNYFGLQGENCYCIDTFAGVAVTTDTYCTKLCPGDTSERCGGNNSLTIYMNDICFDNSKLWKGSISRTREGNVCLPWKNITTISGNSNFVFPDGSAQNASNYCRNPLGQSSDPLWCYVSETEHEVCYVPRCIRKGLSSQLCMMVYRNRDGDLVFLIDGCTRNERALCIGTDKKYYNEIDVRTSWMVHRQNIWTSSNGYKNCKAFIGPAIFHITGLDRNSEYYWTGYFRGISTSKETDPKGRHGQCHTLFDNGGNIEEKGVDCQSNRNFICQTVPVNCGGHFENFINHSFSTPGYPDGYEASLRCVWTVIVPENHFMMWNVSVDIETSPSCRYDYLKIYYGTSTTGYLNSTICGRAARTFVNTRTNITLEFQSDETENFTGILVTWTMVPIPTSTIATSTSSSFKQSDTRKDIELSSGSLAGLIVGVVFLLVLSCVGGFLCGTRSRTCQRKDTEQTRDKETENRMGTVNSNSLQYLNKLDSESNDKSYTNAGFDDSGPEAAAKKERKHPKGQGVNVETDGSLAIYSKVSKPTKDTLSAPNTLSPGTELTDKPDKSNEQLYNCLNEKDEKVPANTAVNIYNHLNDAEEMYDDPVPSTGTNIKKHLASDLDMYDH